MRDAQVETVIGSAQQDRLSGARCARSEHWIFTSPRRPRRAATSPRARQMRARSRCGQAQHASLRPRLGASKAIARRTRARRHRFHRRGLKTVARVANGAPRAGTELLDVRVADQNFKAWADLGWRPPAARRTADRHGCGGDHPKNRASDLDAIPPPHVRRRRAKSASPMPRSPAPAWPMRPGRAILANSPPISSPIRWRRRAGDRRAGPSRLRGASTASIADEGPAKAIARLDGLVNTYGPLRN